jgi:4-amino-4-deoxy-L-arabinose transferase-like glycosyltransferase
MAARFTNPRLAECLALAACAFFFLAGQPFLPLLGIQNDEALFECAFLNPRGGAFVRIGHWHLPVMLMSYVGALKAWLYRPIFALWKPGAWSLREPALLAGAVSIWLFFLLLRRMAGARAAVIGCWLLAVDAMYLLTTAFDWGPVVLQHLLMVGGVLLVVRFYQERRSWPLAAGFFCLGLAMWDKALAIWMLSGMGVAVLAVCARQVRSVATRRRVAVAVLSFGLGALPLIAYNVGHRFATFRGQSYDTSDLALKGRMLLNTVRGDGLFGWLVDEDRQTAAPHQPRTALEEASGAVAEAAGNPRHSLLLWAFLLALAAAPLAGAAERRAIWFALIVMAAQWTQMAVTSGAGLSVHHTILLWPLPQAAIGISFAAASRRIGRAGLPVAIGVLAVAVAAGALQINEYYRYAWRNGGGQNWTDAIYPLAAYAEGTKAKEVYCLDWGIVEPLRVLGRGRLPLDMFYAYLPDQGPLDAPRIRTALAARDHLFLAHTKEFEFFAGPNAKLLKAAEAAGYRRETVAVISDSFDRATYEAYRFTR